MLYITADSYKYLDILVIRLDSLIFITAFVDWTYLLEFFGKEDKKNKRSEGTLIRPGLSIFFTSLRTGLKAKKKYFEFSSVSQPSM